MSWINYFTCNSFGRVNGPALEPRIIKPAWHQDPYAKPTRAARPAAQTVEDAGGEADQHVQNDTVLATAAAVDTTAAKAIGLQDPVRCEKEPTRQHEEWWKRQRARNVVPILLAFCGGSALSTVCTRLARHKSRSAIVEGRSKTASSQTSRSSHADVDSPFATQRGSSPKARATGMHPGQCRGVNSSKERHWVDSMSNLSAVSDLVHAGDVCTKQGNVNEAIAQYLLAAERDSSTMIGAEARRSLGEVLASRGDVTAVDWFLNTALILKRSKTNYAVEVDKAADMLLWSIQNNMTDLKLQRERARLALQLLDARVTSRSGQVRVRASSELAAKKALTVCPPPPAVTSGE